MIKEIQLVGAAILILLFNPLSQAQGWKSYPYHQDGTLIYFPRDEGSHPEFQAGSGTEWWYVNMHLRGDSTQHDYSAMVAFFNYNFRIFNIADETEQDFHSFTNFGLLSAAQECLNLKFYPFFMETENWLTKTDSLGKLVPFQYVLKVGGDTYALAIDLDAQKPPLIIGKDGLVTVGSGDSYYYSQTQLVVTGTLKFKGKTEPVSGIAWIDHQYGPFLPRQGVKNLMNGSACNWTMGRISISGIFSLLMIKSPRTTATEFLRFISTSKPKIPAAPFRWSAFLFGNIARDYILPVAGA